MEELEEFDELVFHDQLLELLPFELLVDEEVLPHDQEEEELEEELEEEPQFHPGEWHSFGDRRKRVVQRRNQRERESAKSGGVVARWNV